MYKQPCGARNAVLHHEIAHTAPGNNTTQPVRAYATNIVKYGAPSVAVVTAVLTAIPGASWKVDPTRPAVLFSTALIIAAVDVGIYYAFGSDDRTPRVRYPSLGTKRSPSSRRRLRLPRREWCDAAVQAALTATQAQLHAYNKKVTQVTDDFVARQAQNDQVLGQLRDTEALPAEAKRAV